MTARLEVKGFHLGPAATIPSLDAPCGDNSTYGDLIECGETQAATKFPHLPREPATYACS